MHTFFLGMVSHLIDTIKYDIGTIICDVGTI